MSDGWMKNQDAKQDQERAADAFIDGLTRQQLLRLNLRVLQAVKADEADEWRRDVEWHEEAARNRAPASAALALVVGEDDLDIPI